MLAAKLELYIKSELLSSKEAEQRLCDLKRGFPKHIESIKIIDVSQNAELAKKMGIMVTPTLIIVSPAPSRRIMGSLEGLEGLLGLPERMPKNFTFRLGRRLKAS